MKNTDGAISRRSFLRSATLALGASGAAGVPTSLAATRPVVASSGQGLPITIAGYPFDRVADLASGRVKVEGCSVTFEADSIGNLNTHAFSGPGTRTATEIGMTPFIIAYANDAFRDYALLPVFPLRQFRHKSIFVRTDRGIEGPEDLRGKRVGTPGYSSTSLTWIRGFLQDEYGVTPADVEWVVSAEDSAAADTGNPSAQENVFPEGLSVSTGPAGLDESDLLESGAVDALFHAVEPRGFVEGNPIIARLFSDYREVESDYYRRTGIYPIMHAVAVRRDVVADNPWLPGALFDAYSQAQANSYERMNRLGWASDMLPWYAWELEQTRALMGDDFYSFGLDEANRNNVETLCRYCHEQGLTERELAIEDLFLAAALELSA